MTLSTAETDGLRHVVRVEGGQVFPLTGAAGPRGTEIVVEDLFYNTPARLKFLKSDTTELGQAMDHVARYAMAYPHVAFTLRHNGQLAIGTSGDGDLHAAVSDVWGRETARTLAPIDDRGRGDKAHGARLAAPRHEADARVPARLRERPPRADADPHRRRRRLVPRPHARAALPLARPDAGASGRQGGRERLAHQERGQVPAGGRRLRGDPGGRARRPDAARHDARRGGHRGGERGPRGGPARSTASRWSTTSASIAPEAPPVGPTTPTLAVPQILEAKATLPFADLLDGLRVIGQVMNTFIVAETTHGVVLIDQHVAHERVLYEYLCGIRGKAAIEQAAAPRSPDPAPGPPLGGAPARPAWRSWWTSASNWSRSVARATSCGRCPPPCAGATRITRPKGACRGAGRGDRRAQAGADARADLDHDLVPHGGQGGRPLEPARDGAADRRTSRRRRIPTSAPTGGRSPRRCRATRCCGCSKEPKVARPSRSRA